MAKETVESLCQKAQQAIAQGANEQARQLYQQALAIRSDLPDVHYGLGTVCFLLNDLNSSAHHFKEVTKLDALRASAYINLGAVYNRLDMLDQAIPILRRGIQLDMNRAEGYYNLGLVYKRKGQNDLAIQAYQEATRVNPRMADAHYNLANLFMEKGQFGMAQSHYRTAVELRPTWEKARRGLEQSEAALSMESTQQAVKTPAEAQPQAEPVPAVSDDDLERVIDPNKHGALLTPLHRATIDSDNTARRFLNVLEKEVEIAIKDLSTCLLYPSSSAREVETHVEKFEAAVANLQSLHTSLQEDMEKVRLLGEKLFKS